jgi:hypothetical protein
MRASLGRFQTLEECPFQNVSSFSSFLQIKPAKHCISITFNTRKQHYLWKTTLLLTNVSLQHMAILLYIQKAQGTNLSPETGYPKRLSVVFLNPFRKMPLQYPLLRPYHFLPLLNLLFTGHPST